MSFLIIAWVSWFSKISKRWYLIWIISILKLFFPWDPQAQFLPTRYQFDIYSTCKIRWQIFCFDLRSKILVVQFLQKVLLKFSDLGTQTLFPFDPKTRVLPSIYQLNFCGTFLYQWKIFCFDFWWGIPTVRRCQKCSGSSRYSISMFF